MSTERDIALRKYFAYTPQEPEYADTTWLAVLTVGGLLSALIGFFDFKDAWWLLCLGVPVTSSAGSAWFTRSKENNAKRAKYEADYSAAEPKPSRQQVESWLSSDLERIKKLALDSLDLTPDEILQKFDEPIIVLGAREFPFHIVADERTFYESQELGQMILLCASYNVLIIYPTNQYLAIYGCVLNFYSGLVHSDFTREYHYNDIVSVQIESSSEGVGEVVEFSISMAGNEKLETPLFPSVLRRRYPNLALSINAEKAFRTIRSIIREKKN